MTKIQLRRDTAVNWTTNNPTPASGEPCFETDTGKFKIGDGTTAYNDLAYQGGGGGATIDDSTIETTSVWSSSKTNTEITTVANKVVQVQGNVVSLDGDVSTLKTDVSGLNTNVSGIKTDVSTLKTDVSGLKTDVSGLKTSKQDKLIAGDNITIDPETNTISAAGGGGSAPTNMVTTDTDQTITGKKVFLQPNSANKGLDVALGSNATNPDASVHIGKASNSDFTGGMIRFDSNSAAIVGLQQQNSGGTMKIASSGDLINYATGTTEIRNGATWNTSKSGIRIPANSKSYPKVEIIGGSNTVGSSSGVDAKVFIGYEGTGSWSSRKGIFIDTSANTNASDWGAKLWLGQINTRSAIYPVNNPTIGRCLNFETYVGDNTNATLSIQKSDVVYTDKDGVAHSLISGGGANVDLSNLSSTGNNNLVDNNCYDFNNPTNIAVGATGTSYTMPVTGLLYIQGAVTSSSGFIGYKLPDGNFNNTRTPLGSGTTLAVTLRVKKGQTIIIQYGETNNIKALVYPCFPSSGGGSDGIIVLDSDGMGLTVKAGTYTSRTNEQVPEAKTVSLPADTHFEVNNYRGNNVMLLNSGHNKLAGELVLVQVGTGSSVNNGLSGQSGWTGSTGKLASDGSVISTFRLIPEKGKGLYTTDTVNVDGDIEANIKWAYTGTSISDTTSRTMELKLSVLHSDGTETLCGTKTESQPCQQTITVNSSDKTVSLSGSWYKTYSLNTTIPAKSMIDGDKLKFTVTYKNSTSATGICRAEAIQPEITSSIITGTVHKIGFKDGKTEGTYMIYADSNNIWDLGYITMSNTVANKMDKWTKTNPQ